MEVSPIACGRILTFALRIRAPRATAVTGRLTLEGTTLPATYRYVSRTVRQHDVGFKRAR
jgi:hypothetical protein